MLAQMSLQKKCQGPIFELLNALHITTYDPPITKYGDSGTITFGT
jgi:hypothetical protein